MKSYLDSILLLKYWPFKQTQAFNTDISVTSWNTLKHITQLHTGIASYLHLVQSQNNQHYLKVMIVKINHIKYKNIYKICRLVYQQPDIMPSQVDMKLTTILWNAYMYLRVPMYFLGFWCHNSLLIFRLINKLPLTDSHCPLVFCHIPHWEYTALQKVFQYFTRVDTIQILWACSLDNLS